MAKTKNSKNSSSHETIRQCKRCDKRFSCDSSSEKRYCSPKCGHLKIGLIASKADLINLYIVEKKTSLDIASIYGVTKSTVLKWFSKYDIETRPCGIGLRSRGIIEPTTEELHKLVHIEHKSYREIGDIYGVDPSTIQHWVRKHKLPAPLRWATIYKRDFPIITKETLYKLYVKEELSTAAIAEFYGITPEIIQRRLKSFGIEVRKDGWNNGWRYHTNDGKEVRSCFEMRVSNWLYENSIPYTYEPRLPFAPRFRADFLVADCYIEIWGVKNAVYEERKNRKIALYKANKADLLQLTPRMFYISTWQKHLRIRFADYV